VFCGSRGSGDFGEKEKVEISRIEFGRIEAASKFFDTDVLPPHGPLGGI
jgi:hypothetical protein